MIVVIVARDRNGLIGKDGDLPWGRRQKGDLRRFKQLTTGHAVIMGRRTFDSIGQPLPSRQNIVITRQPNLDLAGCQRTRSLQEALNRVELGRVAYIIGGASIYEAALPRADAVVETEIVGDFTGDVYFPRLDPRAWQVGLEDAHDADVENRYPYIYRTYQRRRV
jgi:dihydrofolate reductase